MNHDHPFRYSNDTKKLARTIKEKTDDHERTCGHVQMLKNLENRLSSELQHTKEELEKVLPTAQKESEELMELHLEYASSIIEDQRRAKAGE